MTDFKLKGNRILRIEQDENPESPREWDNLGTMVCFHGNYNLGDKSDFENAEQLENFIENENTLIVILPIYLYDHSGISISTNTDYPFNCNWDSGKVGYIYVTKKQVMKEYDVKTITKKTLEKVKAVLLSEIKVYDQYVRGEVYGYTIFKNVKCDSCDHVKEAIENSCWGFYGYETVKEEIEQNEKIGKEL